MTVNKRKKSGRYRGSKTHGCGSMKKRRGSGHRGGKGMAGSGKRSDSKKPSIWKSRYFGKRGFTNKTAKNIIAVNIGYLNDNLKRLTSQNLVNIENDVYSIDLNKLGFKKLLSLGKVTNKFKIKVVYASKKAIDKVKSTGGEVILG